MPPKTDKTNAEKVRESVLASARDHAHVAVQRAEFLFNRGGDFTAGELQDLSKAADRLAAYLYLERYR